MNKEPAVRAINRKCIFILASFKSVILYNAPETLEYHKKCIVQLHLHIRFNILSEILWYYYMKTSP